MLNCLEEALTLLSWAARERRHGHRIASLGERNIIRELVSPLLERVAPQYELPRVDVHWTQKELESLAKLAAAESAEPTKELIDAMKGH